MLDTAVVKRVQTNLNDRFHYALQEAQKVYTAGIPLGLIASFFGVQIASIGRNRPQFKAMVIEAIDRNITSPPTLTKGKSND